MGRFYPAKIYRRFLWRLKWFRPDFFDARVAYEKDNVVLVTGALGDGKSTWVGKICFEYYEDIFKPYEDICYSQEGLFDLMKRSRRIVWADEAVVNASKGGTMTKANKILKEIKAINRKKLNTIFFLMPYIEQFDSGILQFITMWVHVDSRGMGVVMMPNKKGIFGKKNWDVDSMKKLHEEFKKDSHGADHVPYWIYPNFRGYVKFGKMKPKHQAIYDEINDINANINTTSAIETEADKKIDKIKSEDLKKHIVSQTVERLMDGDITGKEGITEQLIASGYTRVNFRRKVNDELSRKAGGKTINDFIKLKKVEKKQEDFMAAAFD